MKIERLDDDYRGRGVRGRHIACDVNLRIAPASQAVKNVVATIEPALLKFKFRHPFALSLIPLRRHAARSLDARGRAIVATKKKGGSGVAPGRGRARSVACARHR